MKKQVYIIALLSVLWCSQVHLVAMEQQVKAQEKKTSVPLFKRRNKLTDALDLRRLTNQFGQYVDAMALLAALGNHYGFIEARDEISDEEDLSDDEPQVRVKAQERAQRRNTQKLIEILIRNIKLELLPVQLPDGGRRKLGHICNVGNLRDFLLDVNRYYHSEKVENGTKEDKRKKSEELFDRFVGCFNIRRIKRYNILGDGVSVDEIIEKVRRSMCEGSTDAITTDELLKLKEVPFIAPYFQYVHVASLKDLLHAIVRMEDITEEQLISTIDFSALFADESYTEEELETISVGCRKACLIALELAQDPSAALIKLLGTLNHYPLASQVEESSVSEVDV